MVVTNNKKIAEKAQLLRNHAFTKTRFLHEEIGFNYRMTNVQAAIGLAQLENINKFVKMRINNAKTYNKLLKNVEGITLPPCKEWAKNVYWMYGILLNEKFGITKDELRQKLLERGIDTRSFFTPLHKQPVFKKKNKRFNNLPDIRGNYPVSDRLGKWGLYLPSASSLTKEEISYIAGAIKDIKEKADKTKQYGQ